VNKQEIRAALFILAGLGAMWGSFVFALLLGGTIWYLIPVVLLTGLIVLLANAFSI